MPKGFLVGDWKRGIWEGWIWPQRTQKTEGRNGYQNIRVSGSRSSGEQDIKIEDGGGKRGERTAEYRISNNE